MQIRVEQPEDIAAVRSVNMAAFGRSSEADLVDRLRDVTPIVSFVAVADQQIVGHIFYSPVAIEGDCPAHLLVLGLAPMAVLPQYQRQGSERG